MTDIENIKDIVRKTLNEKLGGRVHCSGGYIFAANWKMNQDRAKVAEFANEIKNVKCKSGDCIMIFPPFVYIDMLSQALKGTGIGFGAQNTATEKSGAYTGEISADMIADFGCKYTIVGHSERRNIYGETDEQISKKVRMLLSKSIYPLVCVGEKLDARKDGSYETVIKTQLTHSLAGLKAEDAVNLIIAYEPVWAIGTGMVANTEQIEGTHKFIRAVLVEMFGKYGKDIPILYGGSVKPDNIKGISKVPEVSGFLVGGASLKVSSFKQMIDIVEG